jgi:hypothetical protein
VTRPRAADDFPMIRARMVELRCERARPRAADDFAMIRGRMEELRRERAQALAEARGCSVIHPRPLGFVGDSRQAGPVRPVYNADQPITALKGTGIRTLGPPTGRSRLPGRFSKSPADDRSEETLPANQTPRWSDLISRPRRRAR